MKNTQKGFTLVELLVVIAILAILAGVGVAGYTAFITNANDSAAQQELVQLRDKAISDDILNDKVTVSKSIVMTVEKTATVGDATAAEAAVVAYLKGLVPDFDGTITVTATTVENKVTEGETEVVKSYTVTVSAVTYVKGSGSATWTLSTGKVASAE